MMTERRTIGKCKKERCGSSSKSGDFAQRGDFILKNSGINLKKLPNRFHGNHPAYTNWIRDRFSDLASEGNFNKAGIQGVIKKANSEINKAYKEFQKSGQSLNDYFKKK